MGGDLHAPKGLSYSSPRTPAHPPTSGPRVGTRGESLLANHVDDRPHTSPLPLPPDPLTTRVRPARMLSRNAEIWSPAGGFFADPKNWRRNTVVAAIGIATVAAFIFKKSTSLEERHASPNHRIPSQRFAPQSFPVAEGK